MRRNRANALRMLSADAVQKANSGHPGMPMGMADIAEVLWHDFLQHHPKNPNWFNRDRFVLSNGHGSMLLYALLHLTGYDLQISDLQAFRQLHSKTPGHPEHGITPGVETTTGPLGQGLANAVGMAIAEKHLAAEFNRLDFPIIDHYTYVFVGDGCLMEGISHEVCSLAGTLQLGKLIVFYDDNGISIDGEVSNWFSDNTPKRFEAYGWHVIPHVNGHDSEAITLAIQKAQDVKDRPTIICCQTTIGWGAPNLAGTAATHGAALGDAELALVRDYLNWSHKPFEIPSDVTQDWNACTKGEELEAEWNHLFERYLKTYPELGKELVRRIEGKLPENWAQITTELLSVSAQKKDSMATRKASQFCLNHLAPHLPELMGGSADLTESNCTDWKTMTVFSKTAPEGQYIHYGVREFGMSAILNGLALSGAIIPFGATFLTFSDYARNAIRLSALMNQRVIYIYTHDSIGLGEDGPTHQPIEQLPSLRLIPNLSIWRPCDLTETAVAWCAALENKGPTCLLFSRQALPCQDHFYEMLQYIAQGGYVLQDVANAEIVLIATGSEVALARAAQEELMKDNIKARVVSMPSPDVFLKQDATYQESVLPSHLPKIAIEAASSNYWYQFVGKEGRIIGIDRFGASAKAQDVFIDCGLTVENIVKNARELLLNKTQNIKKQIDSTLKFEKF